MDNEQRAEDDIARAYQEYQSNIRAFERVKEAAKKYPGTVDPSIFLARQQLSASKANLDRIRSYYAILSGSDSMGGASPLPATIEYPSFESRPVAPVSTPAPSIGIQNETASPTQLPASEFFIHPDLQLTPSERTLVPSSQFSNVFPFPAAQPYPQLSNSPMGLLSASPTTSSEPYELMPGFYPPAQRFPPSLSLDIFPPPAAQPRHQPESSSVNPFISSPSVGNNTYEPMQSFYKPVEYFYSVIVGRRTGVYSSWEEVQPLVRGFPEDAFRKYNNLDDALKDYFSARTQGFVQVVRMRSDTQEEFGDRLEAEDLPMLE